MCGVCGIIYDDPNHPVDRFVLETMTRTMEHRGPDDEGYFIGRGAGLGMRRLSIIDVEGGHQPFSSEDGLIYAICNGELYNFRELKKGLIANGHIFATGSDAEVLPHLYEENGPDLVSKLNGMFGLAVWHEKERRLLLARDRMGEKPLYWTHQKGMFIFSSELKGILAHPDISSDIERSAMAKYLAYEYVPAPHTIIKGIHKLEPGHLLVLSDGRAQVRQYWDVPAGAEAGGLSEDDAVRELKRLMEISVARRLVSDVPLGVFLSGGIDSSTVVAAMAAAKAASEIKTFSISFEERSFDESAYSARVARHFGTDHRSELCRPADLQAMLPQIANFLDEPLGDASIIPTFALSRFTKKHVTVALGGDGGDELFAGYPTFQAEKYARVYRALPGFLRHGMIEPLARLLPVSDDNISFDFKIRQFLKGASIADPTRHFVWMGSFSPDELKGLLTYDVPDDVFGEVWRYARVADKASEGNRLLYIYKKLYLAEDLLTKVDRASMMASLEVRSPFLDHELVEFVSRLPYQMKLKGLTMKYLLKKAFGPVLPKGIAARPKKGFGIPVAKWLKGPLKGMMLELLDTERIRKEGNFRPAAVLKLVKDHVEGKVDNRKKLWTLIMFEMWLERWGDFGASRGKFMYLRGPAYRQAGEARSRHMNFPLRRII